MYWHVQVGSILGTKVGTNFSLFLGGGRDFLIMKREAHDLREMLIQEIWSIFELCRFRKEKNFNSWKFIGNIVQVFHFSFA